jgi:hypothetical protein
MTQEIYISALDWLGRGFSLLPVYPRSKYIVKGFGIEASIQDQAAAARVFLDPDHHYNLAVVCPPGTFVLDFETWDFYLRWVKWIVRFDDAIARTYTELTPGGGAHVFLTGDLPGCYVCRPHVEIKRHCLVAPSVVSDFRYEVFFEGSIYQGSMDAALFYVLRPCPDSASQLVTKMRSDVDIRDHGGLISKIKGALSIVDLVKKYYPKLNLKQRGDFYNCLCPFHADKNPSFWINTKLNIFGCHTCKARGDVINFYALIRNINIDQAVRDLMIHVC